MCTLFQGANSVEEAVNQFYENPDKYSETAPAAAAVPSMSTPVPVTSPSPSDAKEAQAPIYSPPPYAPPPETTTTMQHRPHTNPIIQAGHVRARDEVRFLFMYIFISKRR